MVSVVGYPLAYEIFEENKFEGHTMLPVINGFKEKYKLDKLVVIADSGLLSNKNIAELQNKGYEYILGAIIKNETQSIKDKILESNQKLSENRAKSVINYLIENGIDAKKLTAIGFGESKPVASNKTEEGKALNQRTEFKVIKINRF